MAREREKLIAACVLIATLIEENYGNMSDAASDITEIFIALEVPVDVVVEVALLHFDDPIPLLDHMYGTWVPPQESPGWDGMVAAAKKLGYETVLTCVGPDGYAPPADAFWGLSGFYCGDGDRSDFVASLLEEVLNSTVWGPHTKNHKLWVLGVPPSLLEDALKQHDDANFRHWVRVVPTDGKTVVPQT